MNPALLTPLARICFYPPRLTLSYAYATWATVEEPVSWLPPNDADLSASWAKPETGSR